MRARCRLGFERRVDAAIYVTVLRTKTRSQSSEHGVVATGEHGHPQAACCVERHVWLLRDPDAVEQDGQLACYRHDSLVLRLLATSGSQMQAPLAKR